MIGPSVLFRCDGSATIGLGHVVRCLALADELQRGHGCRPFFAMRGGPLGREMVARGGYPVLAPARDTQTFDTAQWLEGVAGDVSADVLILDVRDDLSPAAVARLREQGVLIVTIDDPSERRLAADLAFYPPVPQVSELDWTGFAGELHVGWEWVVLRSAYAHRVSRRPHEKPVVLVTMGGSDPAGLTAMAVEALGLLDKDFEAGVILGPGFSQDEALTKLVRKMAREFVLYRNVSDMPALMARADLAIASFGVTAYELAATGVPAVYLCLTDDHARSASAFVKAGMAVSLGTYSHVSPESLAQTVLGLLEDEGLRARMAERASGLVHGRGAALIASRIAAGVRHKYV